MRNRSVSWVAAAVGLSVAGLVAIACSGGAEGSAAPRLGAGGDGGSGGGSAGNASAAQAGTSGGGTSAAGGKAGKAGATSAGAGGATSGGAGGATSGGAAGTGGATSGGAAGTGGATSGGAGGATSGGASGATSGGAAGSSNDGGLTPDTACAAVTFGAKLEKRPIDIILLIDNSGSMGNDIVGVQDNINKNFADILNASTIDWRLVLISRHGKASAGESICVGKPLSGHDCTPTVPMVPVNTSKFFHYSQEVASRDSLQLVLSTYNKVDEFGLAPNGWQEWLRADAFKVFLEITDDRSDLASATFQADLLKLVPARFGVPGNPDYVFHSIIGLEPNNPATAPWPPGAPIKTATCGAEAVNAGQQYQELSIATGGMRFPICDKTKFDAVFQAIAAGVISGAKISCDLPVPPNPPGQTIDSGTIEIEFSGSQPTQLLDQISGTAGCDDKSFYITNGQIHLCPNTCKAVQADPMAKLDLLVGCGKI